MVDDRIEVDGVVVVEGLNRGEIRPMAKWVQSRLTAGETAEQIRAEFVGTTSADPSEAPADLSLLEGTVKAVKAALETGDHDAHLPALLDAETRGKARKGVLEVLKARSGGAAPSVG